MTAPGDLRPAACPNAAAAGDALERALDEMARVTDAATYAKVEELLRLVTDLYGAGLARVLEIAGGVDPGMAEALAADELVGSLLLVHDLHPRSLAERVEAALAEVRPMLARHAGDVELVDIDPSLPAVRLRLLGSCDGCPSSAVTLQSAVERAILEAAPEIQVIDVDEPASGAEVPVGIEVAVQIGSKLDV